MSDSIQINVSIEAINELRFLMAEPNLLPSGDITGQLQFNQLLETEIDKTHHKVIVNAGAKYALPEQTLCELVINVVFSLEPFDSIIKIDPDQRTISFAAEFIPTLLNVAYGTLRGILAAKTKDTPLAAYPLQMVQMEELTKMNRFRVKE